MKNENNVKQVLFEYVKNPKTWFYWYHNPKRLEALFKEDHKTEDDYKEDTECHFTKNVWRFEESKNVVGDIKIEKNLVDFFDAVLDEVRLKKANLFAEYALYISDNEDLAYFRDTVARREISADIDYDRQRDHAVHTLYNYIFGWYIFENSDKLQQAFRDHFKKLKIHLEPNDDHLRFYRSIEIKFCEININSREFKESISLVNEFAEVWSIASLLHDIGYILEGNLSSASPEVENVRVSNGSKIIHDYFNHWFWKSFEVDYRVAQDITKTLGVVVPDFRYSRSLASLGDHLCDIGSCENIRRELSNNMEYKQFNGSSYKTIQEDHGLNREAFSIWKEHYKFYRNKKMQNILYIVERVYKDTVWIGADHGNRNLDHGVCSGLITLQALTFFHELVLGFKRLKWDSFNDEQKKDKSCNYVSHEIFEHISDKVVRVPKRMKIKGGFYSDLWFKKVLWATASAAIHSIIQKPEYREKCKKHLRKKEKTEEKKPLKIGRDDDPLAFLGVLVDVLQEWDRYKVLKLKRGESAFSGAVPLQSTDVVVGLINCDSIHYKVLRKLAFTGSELMQRTEVEIDLILSDIIYLVYQGDEKDLFEELRKKLDRCLEKWRDIVLVIGKAEEDM